MVTCHEEFPMLPRPIADGTFFSPFQTKLSRASYTGFEKGKWERFDEDFDSGIPNLIFGCYAPSI